MLTLREINWIWSSLYSQYFQNDIIWMETTKVLKSFRMKTKMNVLCNWYTTIYLQCELLSYYFSAWWIKSQNDSNNNRAHQPTQVTRQHQHYRTKIQGCCWEWLSKMTQSCLSWALLKKLLLKGCCFHFLAKALARWV